MYLNISKPIKRNVTYIDINNNKKIIYTALSHADIKHYFNAKKILNK